MERILKISQYLMKLYVERLGITFLARPVTAGIDYRNMPASGTIISAI